MGEKLKTPPLIEALCEFRFAESAHWDWVLPGQLYDKIKNDFPIRDQIQGVGFEVKASPKVKPVASIHTLPDRVQLKRADGTAMVQVGYRLLAINQLRPYTSWTEFRAFIMKIFETYHEITKEEVELERIGLRYINQIAVPDTVRNVEELLTLNPPLTGVLAHPLRSFYQRYEIEQSNPDGILIHQTGTQIDENGNPVFVLDLDFGSTNLKELKKAESVMNWLELAHDRIYESFVASLTPNAYSNLRG